jgi:hypothetical protein
MISKAKTREGLHQNSSYREVCEFCSAGSESVGLITGVESSGSSTLSDQNREISDFCDSFKFRLPHNDTDFYLFKNAFRLHWLPRKVMNLSDEFERKFKASVACIKPLC